MRREIQKVEESLGAKGTSQKANAIGHVREDENSTKGRAAGFSGTRGGDVCKEWFRNKINRVEQLTTCGK